MAAPRHTTFPLLTQAMHVTADIPYSLESLVQDVGATKVMVEGINASVMALTANMNGMSAIMTAMNMR